MRKKNKGNIGAFITLSIFLIIAVFGFLSLKNLLYGDSDEVLYGNRLVGIEEVVFSNKKDIIEGIKSNSEVNEATINMSGKIINVHIDVVDEISLDVAKSIASKSLDDFSDEIKEFYDIQFFITQKQVTESELYPVIGYKDSAISIISWIK